MKRRLLSTVFVLVACLIATGCQAKAKNDNTKIKIIATLFPQYDFARQIAGSKAEIVLLIPPGVESHSYEPSPAEIMKINSADVFIYTGEFMETWAHRIVEGLDNKNLTVIDVSEGVLLDADDHSHEDETKEEHAAHENDGNPSYNPHIWTDLSNAIIMVENIARGLCAINPDNARYYSENASAYKKELAALDSAFTEVAENGKRNEVIFGGRNPFYYFLKRYDLEALSAYDSCSSETEPSVKTVIKLTDKFRLDGLPVIFYEELKEPKIARTISEETGAQMLLFHSCHNVSKKDISEGATYLSLMKQNLENLKEALN